MIARDLQVALAVELEMCQKAILVHQYMALDLDLYRNGSQAVTLQ